MHATASVIVIAGRDGNHAAVNNHCTAAKEDNVSHIWWAFFRHCEVGGGVNISAGVSAAGGDFGWIF